MTPKYHANKQTNRRNRSISEKAQNLEEKRNYEKNCVKVINTHDESASAFTRKTKNPGMVRSAYHSIISFSNKIDDHESQDNTVNIIAFEKQIRAAEKVRSGKNISHKKL